MKIILQDKNQFVIRFDKDEEVLEGLQTFMKEQAISACAFFGVGACSSVELAYYNTYVKVWRKKPFIENLEILSITGNGALKDGETIIHAHGVFGKNDFTTIGGHLFKLVVSVTCEISLIKLDGALERQPSSDPNLNLLV
jgi:hypothetical protein